MIAIAKEFFENSLFLLDIESERLLKLTEGFENFPVFAVVENEGFENSPVLADEEKEGLLKFPVGFENSPFLEAIVKEGLLKFADNFVNSLPLGILASAKAVDITKESKIETPVKLLKAINCFLFIALFYHKFQNCKQFSKKIFDKFGL